MTQRKNSGGSANHGALNLLQELSSAVEQAGDCVVICDRDGTIKYVNSAFEKLTGYSREEAIGKTPRLIKSGEHAESFYAELWKIILSGRVFRSVFINRKKNGVVYYEDKTISPLKDSEGNITAFVSVGRDNTERRTLEERLRQAQKMEAVGRLAGGVAHDFNNLLMVIRGYTELLLGRLDPSTPLRRNIEEIQKAADRATSLTRQLLAFSRQQVLEPKVLDLNAVVAGVEKMLRRLIGEDIEVVTALASELGQVKVDPSQIEQIILNLAVNARDAMPQGGALTIETANVELAEAYARQHTSVQPGSYVLLAISDTGCGMDAGTQARIFEPFFTTKEKGKGTGLGLATVYGIVKQSGGYIWVYSEPGHGTTFKIYLPRVAEATPVQEVGQAFSPPPAGSETILLVEDEDGVRKLGREFLESTGYTVLEAQNGAEAIQVANRHMGLIHLMVTDVVMPQMSGRELAHRLAPVRPEMKVLYMSGYTDNAVVRRGILDRGTAFLQKPFPLSGLARKVREVLEEGKE